MEQLIEAANRLFGGPVMLVGMLAVGGLLTVRTGFVQFRRLGYTLRYVKGLLFARPKPGQKGITPFQAVTTALSGTLGTGNIAGVAAALSLGGAGALFWMWVGGFLGMAVKYSEIVLAMRTRERHTEGWRGGPMYYLRTLRGGRALSLLFCLFCLGSSFCMGNMAQSNTAAAAVRAVFPLSERAVRLLFLGIAVLVGLVILGGVKRIARTTELLVPAMAVFYLGGCLVVILMNLGRLPAVFAEVFASAFTLRGAAGGAMGVTMLHAMRVGVTRGVFTNEAGLGSAPIAHSAAENPVPQKQGLWGVFEVFLDTIVMCTLTGIVVLIPGLPAEATADGAAISLAAFSRYLGEFAAVLIGVSTVFFAAASIIGWSYYGEVCLRSLCRANWPVYLYKLAYVAAVYIGAVSAVGLVWELSDLCNSLMMCVNLAGVAALSGTVRAETRALSAAIARERAQLKLRQHRTIHS